MLSNTLAIKMLGMATSLFLGMPELKTLGNRQWFHFIDGQGKSSLGIPNILVEGCSLENLLAVTKCFNPMLFVVEMLGDHQELQSLVGCQKITRYFAS